MFANILDITTNLTPSLPSSEPYFISVLSVLTESVFQALYFSWCPLLAVCVHWTINSLAKYEIILMIMVGERWPLASLVAERMVNTMVLILWTNVRNLQQRAHFLYSYLPSCCLLFNSSSRLSTWPIRIACRSSSPAGKGWTLSSGSMQRGCSCYITATYSFVYNCK